MSSTKEKLLQARIERIKRRLQAIGDMTPGSLSRQYNVCGNPACRCKDPKNPRKHGPYYQLSYTRKGKSTTRFVRKKDVLITRVQLTNYALFRKLIELWIDSAMELSELRRKANR